MRLALLVLVACSPEPPPPAAPIANVGVPVPKMQCRSEERRTGNTCCRKDGEPSWLACRGPQLGKACHRRGDCDIACSCNEKWSHPGGTAGLAGHCTGGGRTGDGVCVLDERGLVSGLIDL